MNEREARLAALHSMFCALGYGADGERSANYMQMLEHVPVYWFLAGCKRIAMRRSHADGIPSVRDVGAACAIEAGFRTIAGRADHFEPDASNVKWWPIGKKPVPELAAGLWLKPREAAQAEYLRLTKGGRPEIAETVSETPQETGARLGSPRRDPVNIGGVVKRVASKIKPTE